MGYHMQSGKYADTEEITLKAAGVEAASTEGEAIEVGDRRVARLTLDVTADASGTTLDVDVECSSDGVNWYVSGSFSQVGGTTPASEQKLFMLDRFVRYVSTIVGTSYTYSISGETV